MSYRITKVTTGKVGTKPVEVTTNGRKFMIRNTHATNTLYMNEMSVPALSKDNFVYVNSFIQLVGSGADTTYEIDYVDEIE